MNSPLDHDFEKFKFSAQNKFHKNGAVELSQNFGTCLCKNNQLCNIY
jgi:hypothetical protein